MISYERKLRKAGLNDKFIHESLYNIVLCIYASNSLINTSTCAQSLSLYTSQK